MKQQEINALLDTIRESGQMNMYEAPKLLQNEFGISKSKAIEAFEAWAKQ